MKTFILISATFKAINKNILKLPFYNLCAFKINSTKIV